MVLVTGASGFLGGRLAQVLADRGETVRVLARPASDLRHLEGLPVEVVRSDAADAVRGVTHIYHCAGCASDWAPWRTYYEANVAGVEELLRAAAGVRGLRRFLHVSTTDVYGYPRVPCDESHPLSDVGLPYNRTKCLGEARVWDAARETGVPATVVRPATIYGPRGRAFVADIAKLTRQGLMAVIGGGRTPGGFCYVDNAVEGIIQAANAEEAVGRAYNLADGTGVTWRRYVDALADGLALRRPWIDIPAGAASALARVMEAPQRWLRVPGRPLLTRHAVLLLSRDQEFPTGRARHEFGFAPAVSFEEGMARSLAWLKERASYRATAVQK
jgi:nucleoside-diphosphate-sugar epimerase